MSFLFGVIVGIVICELGGLPFLIDYLQELIRAYDTLKQ